MNPSELSVFVFGVYVAAIGVGFLFVPNLAGRCGQLLLGHCVGAFRDTHRHHRTRRHATGEAADRRLWAD